MITEKKCSILKQWPLIRERYDHWIAFMEKNVTFSLEDSFIHTKLHCARVLLYALAIGKQMDLSNEDLDALGAAAVFHDTRRHDDWLDVGHGQRAAEYYETFCQVENMAFDKRTYLIMAFHDRDDSYGIEAMENEGFAKGVLLYQIFKDADALDRLRLGAAALDVNMLRTEEAVALVGFAKQIMG